MAIMKKLLILLLFIPYLGFSQIKISALTEATTLNANDWFMAVQGGTTKKVAFYRFSYNQDSTALQITDSLAFYVQKTELSNSLLNYILRTELNDSLANYTSLDSLTYYMKTIDVRNAISDSIAGITSVSLGTANQVAFVNSTGTDLGYSDNFKWNDTTLLITDGNDNIFIGYNSGKNRTASISNVFIGVESGLGNTEGNYNIFNGYNSGKNATVGNSNVFLGAFSGFGTTTGERNIFIGYNSGYSYNGSGNVFIGDNSGYNETGSNKLYIENSTSATPLIWGDFALDSLKINGDLTISGDVLYTNTFWDDLNLSGTALAPAAQAPTLRTFLSGIMQYGYNFQTADDSQFGQAQLSHQYKKGTNLEAHVHLATETNGSAGDTAVFELEYTWADMGETFPTTDTITVKVPLATAIAKRHFYYDLGDIVGTGKEESSCILIRFTRLQTSASDTYNNWVYLLNLDFHYQIDKPGSYNETP